MCADVDWIHLAQNRGRGRNFVNKVMNFAFHKKSLVFTQC
jgi:hypothetical protein